jgi:hypothetical protein
MQPVYRKSLDPYPDLTDPDSDSTHFLAIVNKQDLLKYS